MAIFDQMGKKISQMGQGVVKGTKDITDIARYNSMIADEQKLISAAYVHLGEEYYRTYAASARPPFDALCAAVKASQDKIARYQVEVDKLKGQRRCPACGATVPAGSSFCGNCGAPLNQAAPPEPAPQPDASVCPHCGQEVPAGLTFCTKCGQKLC
jgi:predicted nucleic acid-binding Zn ribbon protein